MKNIRTKLIAILCILLFFGGAIAPLQATTPLRPTLTKEQSNTVRLPDALFDQKIMFLMRIAGFRSLSACIIDDDQIIWSKGYGAYDVPKEKQTTTDTIYILASITKTIVGTALMQLYEQDLFDLDDDVNTYLPFALRNPNYPDDPITIRMLLSHTSSLNTNEQMQYYWTNFSGDPPFSFFPEPYLREFLLPGGSYYDETIWSTQYHPGEHAMYANVGFDLLSYLVELISGEPFLEYCDTHIFTPLDMHNTSFNLSHLNIEQVAVPYQRYAGKYYLLNQLDFIWGNYTPPGMYWRPRFYPAGGLYSTVSDLSHFLIAHMNEGVYHGTRILEKETVELMHQIQPTNTIGYGLAWMKTTISPRLTATGHGGDLPGTDTWMLYNQTKNIGVIYMANGNPANGFLPLSGLLPVRYLLFSLFTKKAMITEGRPQELTVSSAPFLIKSLLAPRPLLG
jgi:CubicO group peptidase (beta-lactamase class C family)